MLIYIIIFLIVVLVFLCVKFKFVIHIGSFFKKGFKLISNKFRVLLRDWKAAALGKTLYVVTFINELRKRNHNLKVVTNVKSFAERNKDYVLFNNDFYDIIHKFKTGEYDTNFVIFFDEIFTLLEKGKLDKSILSFISQLRKRRLYLITTAQEWLEINVTFRRYVRYQVDCSMYSFPISGSALSVCKINDGYAMQWDNLQNEYVAPRLKTSLRKCSLEYANQFDTFETIDENNNKRRL